MPSQVASYVTINIKVMSNTLMNVKELNIHVLKQPETIYPPEDELSIGTTIYAETHELSRETPIYAETHELSRKTPIYAETHELSKEAKRIWRRMCLEVTKDIARGTGREDGLKGRNS